MPLFGDSIASPSARQPGPYLHPTTPSETGSADATSCSNVGRRLVSLRGDVLCTIAHSMTVGAAQWIDHFCVPTNDLLRHLDFMQGVLGGRLHLQLGLTTQSLLHDQPMMAYHMVGRYHAIGGFVQDRMLPETKPPGKGSPRWGFFVRGSDLPAHVARLNEHLAPRTEPVATTKYGAPGTLVAFNDPDGNQYELWAPTDMPTAAMENDNPVGIGRISHVALETRDLERASAFYTALAGAVPAVSDAIPDGTAVLQLGTAGFLVFESVDDLSPRSGGSAFWRGQHLSLTVREDEYLAAHRRYWDELPEGEYLTLRDEASREQGRLLPARTVIHGLFARGERKSEHDRGTTIYDWDTMNFHLVGGVPLDDGMAHYGMGTGEFPARSKRQGWKSV